MSRKLIVDVVLAPLSMRHPHPALKVPEEARLLGPSRLRPDRVVEVVEPSFSTVVLG